MTVPPSLCTRTYRVQTTNTSSCRPAESIFNPCSLIADSRGESSDSRRTRRSIWSHDCSFNMSYIDHAALITIREDCSNSALSSRMSFGRRNIRWEIAAAEETVQDRAWLAGWLVGPSSEFITVTTIADFSIFSLFVNFRPPVPMAHPLVTLGASFACPIVRISIQLAVIERVRRARTSPSFSFPPALTTGYFYR